MAEEDVEVELAAPATGSEEAAATSVPVDLEMVCLPPSLSVFLSLFLFSAAQHLSTSPLLPGRPGGVSGEPRYTPTYCIFLPMR